MEARYAFLISPVLRFLYAACAVAPLSASITVRHNSRDGCLGRGGREAAVINRMAPMLAVLVVERGSSGGSSAGGGGGVSLHGNAASDRMEMRLKGSPLTTHVSM